jgi:hypothetical protein
MPCRLAVSATGVSTAWSPGPALVSNRLSVNDQDQGLSAHLGAGSHAPPLRSQKAVSPGRVRCCSLAEQRVAALAALDGHVPS